MFYYNGSNNNNKNKNDDDDDDLVSDVRKTKTRSVNGAQSSFAVNTDDGDRKNEQ